MKLRTYAGADEGRRIARANTRPIRKCETRQAIARKAPRDGKRTVQVEYIPTVAKDRSRAQDLDVDFKRRK